MSAAEEELPDVEETLEGNWKTDDFVWFGEKTRKLRSSRMRSMEKKVEQLHLLLPQRCHLRWTVLQKDA
jgi:hypothetical protein